MLLVGLVSTQLYPKGTENFDRVVWSRRACTLEN